MYSNTGSETFENATRNLRRNRVYSSVGCEDTFADLFKSLLTSVWSPYATAV